MTYKKNVRWSSTVFNNYLIKFFRKWGKFSSTALILETFDLKYFSLLAQY